MWDYSVFLGNYELGLSKSISLSWNWYSGRKIIKDKGKM